MIVTKIFPMIMIVIEYINEFSYDFSTSCEASQI